MKRNIYNTNFKKMLITILLVIILINSIMPKVVFAATIEKTASYYEWINEEETKEYKDIIEEQTREWLKKFYMQKYPEEEETINFAVEQDLEKSTELMITGRLDTGFLGIGVSFKIDSIGITQAGHDQNQPVMRQYNELLNWTGKEFWELDQEIIKFIVDDFFPGIDVITGSSPEEVAETILELNKNTIQFEVLGGRENYRIISFKVPGKDEQTLKKEAAEELKISFAGDNVSSLDVEDKEKDYAITTGIMDKYTGIILEPTVKFFTFVLDSIMSVFSAVMNGTDFEFVMVDKEKIDTLPKQGKVGANFTISETNLKLYATASGKLDALKYPRFSYSPEELFAGEIDFMDVNFIKQSNDDENWQSIRSVVSQWYQILRMVTIIGLLSVLIYTGIRIIISSNTQDKAKYKKMITNWFVAVILAFSMHYIMAFILSIIDEITNLLHGIAWGIQVTVGEEASFVTNLIGLARFQIQQQHFSAKIGHLIIYTALIVYTFKFTFLYFKRVLKMAFLTIMSPIVALTYPIDKMDGEAKGFNMWLREFIFNALLQPLHYILYYILVSSALTLAVRNPLYGVVAIAFISQAEKLLKKIFGFDKARAGTVGGIAGAFATGAVTSSFISFVKDPLHPFGGVKTGKSSSGNINGNYNIDEEDINFKDDTLNMDDLVNMNLRPTIPGVDDSTFRYRQALPQSIGELGGLHFDDGNHNSLETLLEMINRKQFKLDNENLSPKEREKLQKQLMGLESVLQSRVMQNEMAFGGNMQYTDKYNDTRTMDLINEIKRLNKQAQNPNLSPEERKQNAIKAEKLMKTVKRRMAENQYMQRNNAIPSLNQQNTAQQNEQQKSAWSEFKEKHPTARGLENVGRTIVKPVWDTEKDFKYNGKRLGGKVLKGAAGVTLGVAAAAVQAGVSITDGKYNPIEGAATIGAGIAGVSAIGQSKEKERKIDPEDQKSLEKYSEQWFNDDKVINSYRYEFGGKGKEMRERAVKNYVSRGITDVEEQKKAMNYAELLKKERGLDEDEADKVAVATLQYRQGLIRTNSYMVLYNEDTKNQHIDLNVKAYSGSASKESVRRVHEELIENVRDFDRANQ